MCFTQTSVGFYLRRVVRLPCNVLGAELYYSRSAFPFTMSSVLLRVIFTSSKHFTANKPVKPPPPFQRGGSPYY